MNTIYKYLLCYYAFVKKSSTKWTSQFIDGYTVANICIILHVLMLLLILDMFLPFKGIAFLMHGPRLFVFIIGVAIIVNSIISVIRINLKGKRILMRYAITKTSKIKRVYSFLFIIYSVLVYLSIMMMAIARS